MKRLRLLCLGLAFFALVIGTTASRADDRPTFDSLWQEANGAPDHRVVDEGRDIRVEVPSRQTIYYFTKAGWPEHPGVVKRAVVQMGNQIDIQTQGWSFGDQAEQAAFANLLAQFKAQDAAMRQRMNQKP